MSTELKLAAFRVQNFKSIRDSGWVTVDEMVTPLVGKNEAGKSALLLALYKLNPVDSETFDPLREFPRGRYTYEFSREDWPVITGRFSVPPDIAREFEDAVGVEEWLPQMVDVTKRYSGHRMICFSPGIPRLALTGSDLSKWLNHAILQLKKATSNEGAEAWAGLKTEVLENLTGKAAEATKTRSLHSDAGRALLTQLSNYLSGKITADWTGPIFAPLLEELEPMRVEAAEPAPFDKAVEVLDAHLPKFIYFEDYSTLDDTLVISQFAQQVKSSPHDSKVRTKLALFKHVNLDPEDLVRLGAEKSGETEETIRKRKDERSIILSSASRAMTEKFQGWYKQRKHSFRYHADNDYFRVWVKDDRSDDEIELESRSKGLQWFYSFYLVFLVEAEEGHKNAILLLDEPGLHLHPSAQADLLEYLENLSSSNQLVYSTHSPFMVDSDNLARARVVCEQADGCTSVSGMVWPKDKEAIFPLQAALGYSLAQTLFAGKKTLLVEGITDYWILRCMDSVLKAAKRGHLNGDIVITPAGGCKEIMHFASLYLANDVQVVALFDGDAPGKRYAAELQRALFTDNAGRILFVGQAVDELDAEIEDLIPRANYLAAAAIANPESVKGRKITLVATEESDRRVVSALKSYALRSNGPEFQKDLTARQLIQDWGNAKPSELGEALLSSFERLFSQINAAFAGN